MAFIPPTKIVFSGNQPACQEHIKFAVNQLAILERQMSFQSLNEGVRRISPYPGVFVECLSSFSKHEVRIHVETEAHKRTYNIEPVLEEVREEFVSGRDYLYYVRIECLEQPPGIWTDRVILYKMKFEGTPEGQPLTPDGKPLYNSSKNFSPGQGTVIADVDLLRRILIYPEIASEENPNGITAEEGEALLLKVRRLSAKMARKEKPFNGLNNCFLDWYVVGPLTGIKQSIASGGPAYADDVPDYTVSGLLLSDGFVTGSTTWYFPMAPVSFYEDYDSPLTTWRSLWSPVHGGDTRLYMDMYPWEDFAKDNLEDDVSRFYGTFTITSGKIETYEIYYSFTDYWGVYWRHGVRGINITFNLDEEIDPNELVDGMFFTSELLGGAPSFFLIEMGVPVSEQGKGIVTVGDINNLNTWDEGLLSPTWINVGVTSPAAMALITPLETVNVREYRTTPVTGELCSEFVGKYWELLSSGGGQVLTPEDNIQDTYPELYLGKQVAFKWFGHSEAEMAYTNGAVRGYHYYVNFNGIPDTTKMHSVFILDEPEQEDESYQTKFGSLFYLDELVVSGKSAINTAYNSDNGFYMCDGQTYTFLEDSKNTFTRTLGCVIYIFAPPKVYNEDENGNKTYWDIHSGRVDQDIINPYRCFDLEEYIISVFEGIEKDLDASTWTTKMVADPPLARGLGYFGYHITTGFVK